MKCHDLLTRRGAVSGPCHRYALTVPGCELVFVAMRPEGGVVVTMAEEGGVTERRPSVVA